MDMNARPAFPYARAAALFAAWLLTMTAAAVTDTERLEVYHDFRTAFDAHRYSDALPVAAKLVSLTEEQYGDRDRAMVNPLSNLGATQYRLGDYKNAEQTFLRCVKIAEDSGATADRLLLRPLHGLGATYYASGQFDDASLVLKRALDLSRNLDGLFNIGQIPILDRLIDSLVTLERHDEAERAFEYSVRVGETSYGKADLRLISPLDRYAAWQEKRGRYATARVLYARALQIAEDSGGSGSEPTIDPLEGIARTYRLEYLNGPEVAPHQEVSTDPFSNFPGSDEAPRWSGGERAARMAVVATEKLQPPDHSRRGRALAELGDWYQSVDTPAKATAEYREAWQELALGGSTRLLEAPRQLAYRPPADSVARSGERDSMVEHFVEASFTVTKDGRTTNIIASTTDATESQQKSVLSAVKGAHYAPRLEAGEPVDTMGVKLTERILSKKPRG
jgi:tetratricopeptide (TPR) repeat protein